MSEPIEAAARVAEFVRQRRIAMAGGNHNDAIYTTHTDPAANPADLLLSDIEALLAGLSDRLMRAVAACVADIEATVVEGWRSAEAVELVEAYRGLPTSLPVPVQLVVDFDGVTEQWVGTCPAHGEFIRRPSDTADDHDEVTVALVAHDKEHHDGDGLVSLDWLAKPGASPEHTRKGRAQAERGPLAQDLARAAGRLAGIVGGMDNVTHWAIANVAPHTEPVLLADMGRDSVETRGSLADMEPPELDLIGLQSPLAAVALSALLGALAADLEHNTDPAVVASRTWYAQAASLASALNRTVTDWAVHPVDPPVVAG